MHNPMVAIETVHKLWRERSYREIPQAGGIAETAQEPEPNHHSAEIRRQNGRPRSESMHSTGKT